MRRYGQHFLTDRNLVRKIVETSGLSASDAVLEIGPGRGILTRALAETAKKVLTVEIDRRLHALLAQEGLPPNVELLRADALALDPSDLAARLGVAWKLIANLPYEISSRTLERFLPLRTRTGTGPVSLTLMLQKEVGERIVARPGAMNRLALFCGYFADARLLFSVPRGAFSPPPKVESCIVRLDIMGKAPLSPSEEALFFRLIAVAFASKRKQIRNSCVPLLGTGAADRLQAAGLAPETRPEDISLQQWMTLARRM